MRCHGLIACTLAALLFCSITRDVAAAGPTPRDGGSRWGANYFPNVPLITHEGRSVRFFDDLIKGKVVVINFIYTTCPDSCPLETARLREVQGILGDRVGKDVFMYSISIDPATDTPEVLNAYAKRYQVGPGWLFLTGTEANITLLRKKLGLYIAEIQDGSNDHNLSCIIGNQATGRWMKASPFENPYVLASQIGSWLHNWKTPEPGEFKSYADAPQLRNLSKGESLFRTRCASCHTIGGGDITEAAQHRVGPDLLGVMEMRDRAWLERWLAHPEKVLKEKDPIAVGLLAKYNYVPMPNMRLNELEIDRILEYVDTESRRVENTRRTEAIAVAAPGAGGTKPCCMKKRELAIADAASAKPSTGETKPCCAKKRALAIADAASADTTAGETKPCCMKKQGAIVEAGAIPAATAGDAPPAQPRRHGTFTTSMMLSTGLGCVLLALAVVFTRQRL